MSDKDSVENSSTKQKEPSTREILAAVMNGQLRLANMLEELNKNTIAVSNNLQKGYDSTVRALENNLKPLADIARKGNEQLEQAKHAAAGGGDSGGAQSGGNNGGYYNPDGRKMGMGMEDKMMLMEFMKMAMQPDPSNSMFAQLGQRVFVENTMSQMYSNRAVMNKLKTKNLIDDEDYNTFVAAQDAMYKPLLGATIKPNGQGQPNGNQADTKQ